MLINPRKIPRQERGRFTVDAILTATTHILCERGYGKLTTARVAERAGVSIGSLYQYFPNKAALASAVIDKCCEQFVLSLQGTLSYARCKTLADSIDALIDFALIAHHLTPEVHRVVHELAPQLGAQHRTKEVSRLATREIQAVLWRHAGELGPDVRIPEAAVILETVLETFAHQVIQTDATGLPTKALALETRQLIERYLGMSPRSGKASGRSAEH